MSVSTPNRKGGSLVADLLLLVAIVATLVPRFRARPMTLRYTPKRTTEVAAG